MTEKRAKWFRILKLPFLIIFYSLFLLLGGYIITNVEKDFDKDIRNRHRLRLLKVLDKYNFSYTDPRIEEILTTAHKAMEVDAVKLKRLDKELDTRWKFSSSLFFTATLVTTVGKLNKISFFSKFPKKKFWREEIFEISYFYYIRIPILIVFFILSKIL